MMSVVLYGMCYRVNSNDIKTHNILIKSSKYHLLLCKFKPYLYCSVPKLAIYGQTFMHISNVYYYITEIVITKTSPQL